MKKTLPKIHLACANDELRPVMMHILLTKENIVASDAHIIVCLKTADIFDEEFIKNIPDRCLISQETWKEMCKPHEYISIKDGKIMITRKNLTLYLDITEEEKIGKYPNWEAVIPTKTKEVDSIGINPILLNRLLTAMTDDEGSKVLLLTFNDKDKAIKVKFNNDYSNVYGVIMPAMVND